MEPKSVSESEVLAEIRRLGLLAKKATEEKKSPMDFYRQIDELCKLHKIGLFRVVEGVGFDD